MKIDKLTPEQEKQLEAFRDEWLGYGLKCAPTDREVAKRIISKFYKNTKEEVPPFWFVRSPMQANLVANYLQNDKIKESLKTEEKVLALSDAELRAALKKTGIKLTYFPSYFWGSFEAYWVAFYKFPQQYLKNDIYPPDKLELLDDWCELTKNCGAWYPFKELCLVCDRPKEIHVNDKMQLHCETGPAISFTDGYKSYYLNNVEMQEKHILTPAEQMDSSEILTEKNVEVRRELIRKVGVELLLEKLPHKVLETRDETYELLSIDLSDTLKDCRYLKMINPSIGVFHVEGVSRDCDTIQKALNWRAGDIKKEWKPAKLT